MSIADLTIKYSSEERYQLDEERITSLFLFGQHIASIDLNDRIRPVVNSGILWWWNPATFAPKSQTFRYKLTINVRVDGKPYSASSVIEARQERGKCLAPGWGGSGASGRG